MYEDSEIETIDLTNKEFKIEETPYPKRDAGSTKKGRESQGSDVEESKGDNEMKDSREREEEFVRDSSYFQRCEYPSYKTEHI